MKEFTETPKEAENSYLRTLNIPETERVNEKIAKLTEEEQSILENMDKGLLIKLWRVTGTTGEYDEDVMYKRLSSICRIYLKLEEDAKEIFNTIESLELVSIDEDDSKSILRALINVGPDIISKLSGLTSSQWRNFILLAPFQGSSQSIIQAIKKTQVGYEDPRIAGSGPMNPGIFMSMDQKRSRERKRWITASLVAAIAVSAMSILPKNKKYEGVESKSDPKPELVSSTEANVDREKAVKAMVETSKYVCPKKEGDPYSTQNLDLYDAEDFLNKLSEDIQALDRAREDDDMEKYVLYANSIFVKNVLLESEKQFDLPKPPVNWMGLFKTEEWTDKEGKTHVSYKGENSWTHGKDILVTDEDHRKIKQYLQDVLNNIFKRQFANKCRKVVTRTPSDQN